VFTTLTLPFSAAALLAVVLLTLVGAVVHLMQRLSRYQEQFDLEAEKVRRLRAQLKSVADLHPDRTPVVKRADAEWADKFERLRGTYNKLFARHKALIKEYQRLHRYVQQSEAASASSDGAASDMPPAAPRPSPQQTTRP
jgi:sensor histidine kinase YesM